MLKIMQRKKYGYETHCVTSLNHSTASYLLIITRQSNPNLWRLFQYTDGSQAGKRRFSEITVS